jgi:hypothetical protein
MKAAPLMSRFYLLLSQVIGAQSLSAQVIVSQSARLLGPEDYWRLAALLAVALSLRQISVTEG